MIGNQCFGGGAAGLPPVGWRDESAQGVGKTIRGGGSCDNLVLTNNAQFGDRVNS